MGIDADLRHVTYALSDALDLVGVDDVGHGKRVGIMAAECGRTRGLAEPETTFLFDLGLLHDLGVSSTQVHRSLVAEFDWQGSQKHCEVGHDLLSGFEPLAAMALPVKYHHTRWEQMVGAGVGEEVARKANLILLVDRVDAFSATYHADGSALMHAEEVREQIRARSGSYFAPDLVELFLETSRSEAFWLLLEPRSIESFLQEMLSQGPSYAASTDEVRRLAEIFARIVDAKSPFTAEHSLGVARLSRLLARKMGLAGESCEKIEIAGLLHDLGKLRVPDEVLDKPGRLDDRERKVINAHSFETYRILRHLKGFEEIAPWASYHHEEPGGHGYPFHLMGETLPLEARILRVADIFQAMAQDRPYRAGLPEDEVLGFMKRLEARGLVDVAVLAVLESNLHEAMGAALPRARPVAAAGRS